MQTALQRRKSALFAYFLIPGIALASWVTQTPAIRDAIGASIAQMGLVLAGLSVGSMCGVLISGQIIQKRGTRFTMLLGLSLVCLSLITMAAGVNVGMQIIVGLGLGFFGFGMGTAEIAINMDASVVEQESGKHIMHTLHGCFSLGTLLGALMGFTVNHYKVPVELHLSCVFVFISALLWKFSDHVPGGFGIKSQDQDSAEHVRQTRSSVWTDPRVLLIGCIVFAIALAEGSAYDWLPILLVDEYSFSPAFGSMIFVVFAAVMTVVRFSGGLLLERLGRLMLMRISLLMAALGVACIVLGESQALAGFAVLCWGVGSALGFPLALSEAAEGGGQMAERVKAVATIGYIALLVGPPALGFVGQAFGLRGAFLVVCMIIVIALVISSVLRSVKAKDAAILEVSAE